MEDSAKRRERLMALRTEASERSGPPPLAAPQRTAELPDPLFSSSPSPAEAPSHPPRFDYYTNPSAAFSASHSLNKRKSSSFLSPSPPTSTTHARPNAGPGNYTGPNQPPMHQFLPQFHLPPHAQTTHWRSPVQFQPPPPGNIQPPFGGPGSWQPSRGPPFHMPYTNPPRSGLSSPHFVRGSRGPRPSTNPYSNSYSGSRGTGGRGLGFHNYYTKSMVEDPWIELEPIIGNLVESLGGSSSSSGSRSWLPDSLRKTETTKPEKTANKYDKKLSLAEYLDLSFNQSIDES